MTDSETVDSDTEVAVALLHNLEKHGITRDTIEVVNDDPDAIHAIAHVLRTVGPQAEKRANLKWRKEKLDSDVEGLDMPFPAITEKLASAGYDKLYKVAMATEAELYKNELLSTDEIKKVSDALIELGFDGLRPMETAIPTRFMELWGEWVHIPSAARRHYGH